MSANADGETKEPVLIGETVQPVAGATPGSVEEGDLDSSITYQCSWRKLRYKVSLVL